MIEPGAELARFLRGDADARAFPHREHVRMAFEMLRQHDFAETVHLYSRAVREMASRLGQPQVFHQTITIAFLSLIAERMHAAEPTDFTAFAAGNPELFEKALLSRWYRPERLASAIARSSFILPDPSA